MFQRAVLTVLIVFALPTFATAERKADIDDLACAYRIQVYESFAKNRAEYNRRIQDGKKVERLYKAAATEAQRTALKNWFAEAIISSHPGSGYGLPRVPNVEYFTDKATEKSNRNSALPEVASTAEVRVPRYRRPQDESLMLKTARDIMLGAESQMFGFDDDSSSTPAKLTKPAKVAAVPEVQEAEIDVDSSEDFFWSADESFELVGESTADEPAAEGQLLAESPPPAEDDQPISLDWSAAEDQSNQPAERFGQEDELTEFTKSEFDSSDEEELSYTRHLPAELPQFTVADVDALNARIAGHNLALRSVSRRVDGQWKNFAFAKRQLERLEKIHASEAELTSDRAAVPSEFQSVLIDVDPIRPVVDRFQQVWIEYSPQLKNVGEDQVEDLQERVLKLQSLTSI